MGCRFWEVPISHHGRSWAEGKRIRWTRDGVHLLHITIRYNFFPGKVRRA